MDTERTTPNADTARVVAALRRVGEIWEARLSNGWTPPSGSTFPWAQVRLSLAALVPGLKGAGKWLGTMQALTWTPPPTPLLQKEGEPEEEVPSPIRDTVPQSSESVLSGSPSFRRRGVGGGVQVNTRQSSPRTAALILAGNTPLMAWSPLCACLLAGWQVRVKMSRGETLWPRLFWETLHEADPDVAARVSLDVWAGDDPRTSELVQGADAIVAFGSDTTLAALREQTPPGTPFFGFGHAVSIGLLLPGYTPEEWRGFARDVLMYGQGGCLSPHLLLESPDLPGCGTGIIGGKDMASEMFEEADLLGVAPVTDPAVARAVGEVRDMAAFEGLQTFPLPGFGGELRFTVLCDYGEMPPVLPAPVGHGTVYLVPGDPREIPQRLGPLRGRISCVGIAGELLEPVRALLLAEGVSRICPAGQMQTPPLDWPNGNVDLVAELLRVAASLEAQRR